MKTFTKVLLLVGAMNIGSFLATSQTVSVTVSQNTDVSLQLFYDQLSPHGTWVMYQDFGYVWMPNVGPGFQPYASSGHWVFTDMGWTWYSTYSWGWAPFHYGRWFYDNYYGWMWLPDTQWGPAWVTWRSGGDYYGWSPMAPGININISLGETYQAPITQWVFVRTRDLDRPNVYNYSVNQTNNTTIINNTRVIQNTRQDGQRNVTYVTGPDRNEVQKKKGKPIDQVIIQDYDRPGQDMNLREMRIYKPNVKQDQDESRRSTPVKVEDLNNVKPTNERYPQPNSTPTPPENQNQNNGKSNNSPKKKGNN